MDTQKHINTIITCSVRQQRVAAFMEAARHKGCKHQQVRDYPSLPTPEERKLSAALIYEECMETIRALGFEVQMHDKKESTVFTTGKDAEVEMVPVHDPNLPEIVDGIADLTFVATGALNRCGVADEHIYRAVDEHNMLKFTMPGGHMRDDGKWMKPDDFPVIDINALLVEQNKGVQH